jgi:hypothetical protein
MAMNLHDLPYPIFKCSIEECEILVTAKDKLSTYNCSWFLCCTINEISTGNININLIDKITTSIGLKATLTAYLSCIVPNFDCDFTVTEENKVFLRKIWINKLLEYNGYAHIDIES